jgi:hypothetical protein
MRKKTIDSKYRPFKYHVLSIARIQIAGVVIPSMSSNKFEKYCETIVATLKDEKKCLESFTKAVAVLDDTLGGIYERDKAKDASLLTAAEAKCKR